MEIVVSAEGQSGGVGGPCGVGLSSFCRGNGLWRATNWGDDENFPLLSRRSCREGNLLAVGRPVRKSGAKRPIGELEALRAIGLAPPKAIVRITNIRDPFAVA